MSKIGLVVRDNREEIVKLSKTAIEWIKNNNYELLVEDFSAETLNLKSEQILSPRDLANSADLIISLGGDGTLIGIARESREREPVMLGVNFGTLGFLTEVLPEELIEVLKSYHKGECRVSERIMLKAKVIRAGKEIFCQQAVNDAVIQHIAPDGLVKLDLFYGNEEITRLQADGVIIATPTGSTAYSLAAGGSVVHPNLHCALLTPICPHSLTNRPIILPLEPHISIKIPENRAKLGIIIDGQVDFTLQEGDIVEIHRSKNSVKFVRSPDRGYFKILQGKLNWGIQNN